jgi:CDP-4-dehydro-6-deoxyglucose reductase, E1
MTKPFTWPLAVSPYTWRDKLTIGKWLVEQDRYTMGVKVAELEDKLSRFSGMHALCLSSGSAANQLVAELWKLKNPGESAIVICPAVTWISSVSPWIHAGFDVRFCDVNLTDLAYDYDKLEAMLKALHKRSRKQRVIVFPTALIGHCPDMDRLHCLKQSYHFDLYMDSCENTLSRYGNQSILATCDVTTTSCYASHQLQMVEGGFIFLSSREDYELAKMFRNHGLIRSLGPHNPTAYQYVMDNPTIDPQFLFAVPGTNLRPTDVHAMFGLRDFERIDESLAHRNRIYAYYHRRMTGGRVSVLDITSGGSEQWRLSDRYYLPPLTPSHSGFCLPIFTKGDNLIVIKQALREAGIEVRPIIGANLTRQPALKGYGNPADFPNAEWIHEHGCYVGLHSKVTEADVDRLVSLLISLA